MIRGNGRLGRFVYLVRRHRAATVILLLFVVLAATYSIVDPVFEASDELRHYPYVKYLADGNGLPVQRPEEKTLWEQEGSQPPLYYALAAALTFWINTDDLPSLLYVNPHARVGIPLARDNKNMVIHTAREAFPWRGAALAVHLIRFFSILLGAGTIVCTYALGREVFPRRTGLALGSMVLNAFIPMFLFISASVNNDNLAVFLSSLALVLLIRLFRRGTDQPSRLVSLELTAGKHEGLSTPSHYLVLLGVVLGLAALSKLSALGLFPLAALTLAIRHLRGRVGLRMGLVRWMQDSLTTFVPAMAMAGWWYVRNWRLYGDLLGLSPMLDIAGWRPEGPRLLALPGEFQGFRINFWGLFGGVNVLMRPHQVYGLLDGLSLAVVIGLAVWVWQCWQRRQFDTWPGLLLLVAWITILFVALIRWTLSTTASQGRLMFPAISPLCLLFSLGFTAWFSPRYHRYALAALGGLMFVLAVSAPFTAIRPAYARPPILSPQDVPTSAQRINITYGGVMRLLAFEVDGQEVRPGGSLPVTLYWQSLAPMDEDFSIYIQLFGWREQRLGQRDTYPGGGLYPTSLWSVGDVIRDTLQVPVHSDAIGPVAARMEAGLYRLATMERLPAVDERGQPVGQPVLTRVKVVGAPDEYPRFHLETSGASGRENVSSLGVQPAHPVDADLDHRARLIGYELAGDHVRPGDQLPLTLYWRVTGPFDDDYTVFIHLLDSTERIVGQGDGPPMEGYYPTSFWAPDEVLEDTHTIQVQPDAASGLHRIAVGLYDLETGRRLPVLDGQGQPIGDRIILTTVEVKPW